MPSLDVLLLRLVLSIVIGGIIGAEREFVSKDAGFRTLMLICLGSCLFTLFSIFIGVETSPDRIASNIVTGIGFLGAGVIFQHENSVKGLTTAATVWATAAIGMGIGGGYYWVSVGGAALVLIALFLFTYMEDWIERINQTRSYRIQCNYKEETFGKFEDMFRECRLKFKRNKQTKSGEQITGSWTVSGSEKNHNKFISQILRDDTVTEFDF
jgi:putative Mg2+ transporter-C (MgtC) family protein